MLFVSYLGQVLYELAQRYGREEVLRGGLQVRNTGVKTGGTAKLLQERCIVFTTGKCSTLRAPVLDIAYSSTV